MQVADFLRVFPLRAPNIMLFLGAGASSAAGIPTAQHMTWDFKRSLYCAAQRVSIHLCADLGDPTLRSRLQQYFDGLGGYPNEGSEDEYANYFEAAYPSEADRRRLIDQAVSGATPSYGHLALSALLFLDRARIVWTPNFDRMIEDAALPLLGSTGKLTVATLDTPGLAEQAMHEGRWPLLVKMHGDFQSRRLKNTPDELRAQDARLRHALIEGCKRFGLAVVGYSGRDHSVMDALEEGIAEGHGYPFGLFWFHRPDNPCLPRVEELIENAAARGIDAHIIEIETFDELLSDLLLLIPAIPQAVRDYLSARPRRVSDAPLLASEGTWPVIRLNALPVASWPTVCRRLVCKIGGVREVRAAIKEAGADIVATRRKVGVIAFGSDTEVRKAFAPYGISEFDVHSIEVGRLRFDSGELGLLYDALCRGLARERPLILRRSRLGHLLVVDPAREDDRLLKKLREAAGSVTGEVPTTSLRWAEAIRVRLEHKLDRLWLLLLARTLVESTEDDTLFEKGKEFARNRSAGRFNQQWNRILEAWIYVITGGEETCEIRAFGTGEGIDAVFSISNVTGFSSRWVPE
jgi:NAD-dependent SIR2 family protein deacetylase